MLVIPDNAIENLIIHKIGNKITGGNIIVSKNNVSLDGIHTLLKDFFLSPFTEQPIFFTFQDNIGLEYNKIYKIVQSIFANPKSFIKNSSSIAKHLFDCSEHHMIKEGDLYVMYLKQCSIDNIETDAVGIFKCEQKNQFLKTQFSDDSIKIEVDEGLGLGRIEKGCLILNLEGDDGYRVCLLDTFKKSFDAKYWKEDFLNILPLNDEYQHTKNYLSLTKDFIINELKEKGQIENTDAISLLNKTVDYFKENDHFIEKDFTNKVFEDNATVKSYQKYKSNFLEENDMQLGNEFIISTQAVKKSSKIFKNVLKLDNNFHVYIHGDSHLIEKGYDSKNKKHYYKLFFDEEH